MMHLGWNEIKMKEKKVVKEAYGYHLYLGWLWNVSIRFYFFGYIAICIDGMDKSVLMSFCLDSQKKDLIFFLRSVEASGGISDNL